ncbi:hypothetical protein VNO78_03045 [Psophocarpus tetragonolobus]|uniref:GH18 domain-containing protein n=1 Tax=Psophocarpus tetragonolobus TaxID=3891 RepID=A0AAN9T1C9_PSOTE
MVSRIAISLVLFHVLFCQEFEPLDAQTWVQAGYWYSGSGFPVSNINSALYTHLICAFAELNSSTYELFISPSDEQYFSSFTSTIKQKNPSITTLLSIAGGNGNYTVLSSMVSKAPSRKTFIQSSIKRARFYGFQGLDLSWVSANTSSDMSNMGRLFEEWREAAKSEATNSSTQELILTAAVQFRPGLDFTTYPVESIRINLNWVHVMAYDYYMPQWANFTAAHAALYDPSSSVNTDNGIKQWIGSGITASKFVLGLPFYGYAWNLRNPKDNVIGASATGPAITEGGDMSYKDIKAYIQRYGVSVMYNATYVVNYFSIGSNWVGYDDVEVVKVKVSYARENKLLGYVVWQVPYDDNWALSSAAAELVDQNGHHSRRLLVIILITATISVLLLGISVYYLRSRFFKSTGAINTSKDSWSNVNKNKEASRLFHGNAPDLQVFCLSDIELATDRFSIENKLGEGGYGPVYKAYELWKEGKGMEFADPSLDDTNLTCKLLRCMQIALLCVQQDANDRPSVKEISSMLKSETILKIPQRPAFSTIKDKLKPNEFIMQEEKLSVNDATISEVVAR